jgi:ligand-binding sensor domain-containing protein
MILNIPQLSAINYNFDVYLKLKGLSTEETEEVYQDKEGYIWIATRNGLCRYDGYEVKTYKSDVYSPELFVSNYVNTVAEDNKHNLWIGTSNGLVVFDKRRGSFRKISHNKLRNNNIQSLLITKKNDIWIGTAGGLHRYITEKDSFLVFTEQNTGYTLLGNDIKTLLEDHKGNIWIGTWANGLSRFDITNSRFIPYPKVNQGNSVHVLFQDNNKNIWIGSWRYGLFRIDQPYQLANLRYIHQCR